MRKATLGLIGSHVLSPFGCRSTPCPAPDKPARRAELVACAALRSRLRFGGKVLRLGDHHRDVEAAFGLAAGWTLAKLMPLAIIVAAATALFSLVFSWYYQPFFADGSNIPLDPRLFDLHGVAFAAWTLAAFAIGALTGLLIRRVVPAIAATLAAVAGLLFVARLYLQQHYIAPLIAKNPFNPPVSAWIINGWWTKGGTTISQSTMNQIMNTMFRRIMPAILPKNVNDNDIKFYKGAANSQVLSYLTHHGYTQ